MMHGRMVLLSCSVLHVAISVSTDTLAEEGTTISEEFDETVKEKRELPAEEEPSPVAEATPEGLARGPEVFTVEKMKIAGTEEGSPHYKCYRIGDNIDGTGVSNPNPKETDGLLKKLKECTDSMKSMAKTVYDRSKNDRQQNWKYMRAVDHSWGLVKQYLDLNIKDKFKVDQQAAYQKINDKANELEAHLGELGKVPFTDQA